MKDKNVDEKQLKFALNLLNESQADAYATQCDMRESTVLERLGVIKSLFGSGQLEKFTQYCTKQEGFRNVPETCKGLCQDCKAGIRTRCPYPGTDIKPVEQPSILRKRKQRKKRKK